MAEAESVSEDPASPSPGSPPRDPSGVETCRLCAGDKAGCVHIFGDAKLSESVSLCLPVLVSLVLLAATPCLFTSQTD